jgi:hypothetical protein
MKSLISTKVLLDSFVHLRDLLNGKCNENTCPHIEIRFGLNFVERGGQYNSTRAKVFCQFCIDEWNTDNGEAYICPCKNKLLTPFAIFLRLDDVIDELTEKLNKEYSS